MSELTITEIGGEVAQLGGLSLLLAQATHMQDPSYSHVYYCDSTLYSNSSGSQSTSVPITPLQLQSTSVPGDRENDCTCSEISSSAVIAVSAVSLLLIVTLTTVILTQCLLMIRMRKSKDVLHNNETYAEVVIPTTKHNMVNDVPVTPNEAYAPHKTRSSSEEVTYELVK